MISDTHGRVPAVVAGLFEGVEAILHAGDVGNSDVLVELGAIAPVHAVIGNTDGFDLIGSLPPRAVIDLGGLRVGIAHGHVHGGPSDRHDRLRAAFAGDEVDAVIYGHTHRPCADTDRNPWVLNPGSPSQGRGHGKSVGLLHLRDGREMEFEIREIA